MNPIKGTPEIHRALFKVAHRSTHKRHKTGCVIASKKGIILSDGCSHASDRRINSLSSIHAEIHALARGRHLELDNGIAYIATIARKSGNITFSAPCLTCAIALRGAGIKIVVYTLNNVMYDCINLDDDLSHLKVYPTRWEID